jgi:outer membrane protein OmpA-like peptidoglycan-associated protein
MMNGCPDADGDGVADKDDKCPTVAGAKDNAGCPWPDTDGDGVADKDDKCPTVAGTVANNGCPEVSDETMKKLNDYGKTILFNSGKSSFQKQTIPVLQAMAAILKEYPTAKFSLEGHTDADGSEAMNQKLSEDRAAAVKNFLIENGIDASRLSSKGFGESMPVDSNKTAKGKANNRRVEVKLVK